MADVYNPELLNCPFCGSSKSARVCSKAKNVYRNEFGDAVIYKTFYVRCFKCNARGSTISGLSDYVEKRISINGEEVQVNGYKYYYDKAIEAWNRRADNG